MSGGIFGTISSTLGLNSKIFKSNKEEMKEARRKDFEKQTGVEQSNNKLINDEALKYLLENYDGNCEIEYIPMTKQYVIKIKDKILLIDGWYVIEEYKKLNYLEMLLKTKRKLELGLTEEEEY